MNRKTMPVLLLSVLLCLALAACAAKDAPDGAKEPAPVPGQSTEPAPISRSVPAEEPEPETVWTCPEGITLSLLQAGYPAGAEKLTLILDNASDLTLVYGEDYSIQQYVDGAWQDIDFQKDVIFNAVAYLVRPHSVRTMPYHTVMLARPLGEGLYRLAGGEMWLEEEGAEPPARENLPPWHVDFRVTADARPEPDYALYISAEPVPAVDGCLVTDRLPVHFINNTGKDGQVLSIPHLERKNEAGEWEPVPWKEGVGFCGTPDPLPAEGREWSEDLLYLWGGLEDGTYRLSYEAGATFRTEDMVYGEFTLYTPEDNRGLPLAGGSQAEE